MVGKRRRGHSQPRRHLWVMAGHCRGTQPLPFAVSPRPTRCKIISSTRALQRIAVVGRFRRSAIVAALRPEAARARNRASSHGVMEQRRAVSFCFVFNPAFALGSGRGQSLLAASTHGSERCVAFAQQSPPSLPQTVPASKVDHFFCQKSNEGRLFTFSRAHFRSVAAGTLGVTCDLGYE
jgi:hypothetical protein